ncbi:hypothetical protein GCM10023194_48460 [Planotetraspora phitsanulokensis]|uniref:Uncharacterized protein n=1 Tax=Planotetraspora phitsanulokensis TaxID=575192 RepID=A0A8J3UP32_9ACTN|nr:hypothetical protein Pph01_71680 [Planotetraspora phitsanulokensis]
MRAAVAVVVWRSDAGPVAVRWRCGGGAVAVRWRCGGGAVAGVFRCSAAVTPRWFAPGCWSGAVAETVSGHRPDGRWPLVSCSGGQVARMVARMVTRPVR